MGVFARRAQIAWFAVLVATASSRTLDAQTYLYNQASFAVGGDAVAVVAADFNGDGDLDFATANRGGNTVSIVLGKPDGTFAPPDIYPTGQSPAALVSADFNHDGNMDLAVANVNSLTITLLLGKGDGTFTPGATVSVSGDPQALVAGDWNGDGKVDLAVALTADSVALLLGNGDGSFAGEVDYSVGAGSYPMSITAADFNNDGVPDLATANQNNGTISILLGRGDGTFAASVNYPYLPGTTTTILSVLAADFDGDHNADLAVIDPFNSNLSILFGKGDGTFQAPVSNPVGFNPVAGAVADLNRDGLPDLVVANSNDGTVSVLLNKGNGTFQNHVDYATAGANFVAIGDFNRDGLMDVAATNGAYPSGVVTVLLGNPDGTFARTMSYSTTSASFLASGIAALSLAGNGKLDLITSNAGVSNLGGYVGQISVLRGNGDGTFQSPTSFPGGGGYMAVADFNGDGKPDLAMPGPGNENLLGTSVAVFLGNGDGSFQAGTDFATPTGPFAVAAGDFNGDGKTDLAVVNYGSASLSILLGNGDGTFQGHVDYAVGVEPTSAAVGDFNGDGKQDIAVANKYDGTVSVMLGNGDGTFQNANIYPLIVGASGLVAADVNGDGKLDLVVADDAVSVLLGNGDGTFQPHVDTPPVQAGAVVVGDLNGDGIPDAATAGGASTFSALLGHGDGTFSSPWVFWTQSSSFPNSVTMADFDGDGNQDIAVAGQMGIVTVLLSEPAMAISYPSLVFGSQGVGTASTPLPITITNVGGTRLDISKISAGANFTETDDCVGTLASEAHCTVSVTFAPTLTGSIAGKLTVTDNNSAVAGSVQTVALSGTGTTTPDFTIGVASGSPSSATVSPGGTATYSLSLDSLSGFAQSVTLTCSVAASEATCAVSPLTANPTAAIPASVTVTVTTTARSLAPPGISVHQRSPLLLIIGFAAFFALATLEAALRRHALGGWMPAAGRTRKVTLAAVFFIPLALASCGGGGSGNGGNSNPGTPAGTYSVTVKGTSGNLSHSTTLTLTIS
jgi:hypothetical protein